jgi:hypothetical protein
LLLLLLLLVLKNQTFWVAGNYREASGEQPDVQQKDRVRQCTMYV